MMELFVIRHGPAGASMEDYAHDGERPLTKKGIEKIKAVAKGLKDAGVTFDTMLTSPLVRAYETAEILQKHCMPDKKYDLCDLLRSGASYDELVDYLNCLKGDRIAIVGHEPFLSGFTAYCLTGEDGSFIRLKKGGIATLSVDGELVPGECELVCLIQPSLFIPKKSI